MKPFILLLSMFCIVTSCEVEEIPSTNEIENNILKNFNQPTSNYDDHEANLLIYAYLTGEVIKNDTVARNEFLNFVGTNDTVDIYELLKLNTQFRRFRDSFIEMYTIHFFPPMATPVTPIIVGTRNTGGVYDDDGLIGGSPLTAEESFNNTFNFLTSDNCSELYIPNRINLTSITNSQILCAGHPFDLSDTNFAIRIRRAHSPLLPNAEFSEVSYENNQAGENIIIARPKTDNLCVSTSSIPDIDYTLFVRSPFIPI